MLNDREKEEIRNYFKDRMSDRDFEIMEAFFMNENPPSQAETAIKYGISPSRVHQIVNKSRRRLQWWKDSAWRRSGKGN